MLVLRRFRRFQVLFYCKELLAKRFLHPALGLGTPRAPIADAITDGAVRLIFLLQPFNIRFQLGPCFWCFSFSLFEQRPELVTLNMKIHILIGALIDFAIHQFRILFGFPQQVLQVLVFDGQRVDLAHACI